MLPSLVTNKFKIFLKIPIINLYLKSRLKKQIKNCYRGYQLINKIHGLKYFEGLLDDLVICPFGIKINDKNNLIKKDHIETSLRQNITARLFFDSGKSFNFEFYTSLYKKRPLIYPLPYIYIKFLKNRGINVCSFRCLILWKMILFIFFLVSIKDSCIYLLHNLIYLYSEKNQQKNKANQIDAYFLDTNLDELPKELNNELKFNIFSYVYKKLIKTDNNLIFGVDVDLNSRKLNSKVKMIFQRYPFHYLSNIRSLFKLVLFLIKIILFSPIYIFNSNWWKLFILKDLFFAKSCQMQITNNLSKSYFFEHANICRPLWTFIAQEKGSEIFSYFYSGGTSQIVFDKTISKSPTPRYQNLNWPNYLFWDQYQSDFYKEICKKPYKSYISGPLCKQIESLDKKILFPNKSISVFDISPKRDSFRIKTAATNEFYTPSNFLPFFKDILFICQKHDIQIIFKIKRNNSKSVAHPSYIKIINKIKSYDNVLFINPSTAPEALISVTSCAIHMPLSSTAIISSYMNKPACYYDPNSYISKYDSRARGLEIISRVKELENWILSNI